MTNIHFVLMHEVKRNCSPFADSCLSNPACVTYFTLKNAIRFSSPCKGRVTMVTEAFKLQIGYKTPSNIIIKVHRIFSKSLKVFKLLLTINLEVHSGSYWSK